MKTRSTQQSNSSPQLLSFDTMITPQQGHAYSPAQRLMSRRLRDLIPMATSQLRPQTASPRLVVQDIVGRRRRSKMHYDKKASTLQREFSPGEKVFVKPNPKSKHKPWIYGEVVGNPAPRACLVSTRWDRFVETTVRSGKPR